MHKKGVIVLLALALLLTVTVAVAVYGQSDSCRHTVNSDGVFSGQWATGGCESAVTRRGYAHYYTFTLAQPSEVTILLESTDADTYLYLRGGNDTSGATPYENDDHEGSAQQSQIQETLEAGSYTAEATTYFSNQVGSFTLSITGIPPATGGTPTPGPTLTPTATLGPTLSPTATPIPTPVVGTPTPTPAPMPPPVAGRLSISADNNQVCVLRSSGWVECQDVDTGGRTKPPVGVRFTHITSADHHTCGLQEDGVVACWSAAASAPTPEPTATATPTPTPRPTATPSPTATPTATPVPNEECTLTEPVNLATTECANLWIALSQRPNLPSHLRVEANTAFDIGAFDLEVFVDGSEYCNPNAMYADEDWYVMGCGFEEKLHTAVQSVSAQTTEIPDVMGDLRCGRNLQSTAQHTIFACVFRDINVNSNTEQAGVEFTAATEWN